MATPLIGGLISPIVSDGRLESGSKINNKELGVPGDLVNWLTFEPADLRSNEEPNGLDRARMPCGRSR